MKKLHCLHLLVAALCGELFLLSAQAADAKPPTKLTFQGFLTDSSGTALGASSPVQKAVIFRIYGAETAGTLKWSEQQAVTVDKGHFSALLGEGSAVGVEPRNADLSTVFSGADASVRWMELSVDAAILTPRIQFVASPYAMLAKSANQLVDPNGNPVITPGVGTLTLAGTVSGNGSGLTSLNGANITAGTVADTKLATISTVGKVADSALSPNVALLSRNPQTFTGSINVNGNVGIGIGTPITKLQVNGGPLTVSAGGNNPGAGGGINFGVSEFSGGGSPMAKVQGLLANATGFELQTELQGELGFFTRPVGSFGQSLTERVRITANGNVGIGTTTPGTKLDVSGVVRAFGANPSIGLGDNTQTTRGALGLAAGGGAFSTDAVANDVVLRADSGKLLLQSGIGASAIAIAANNNVGIGTKTPTQAKLVVSGAVATSISTPNTYLDPNSYGQNAPAGPWSLSIYADSRIGALGIFCFSDARIKQIEGRSDAAQDLATILGIEVTDYTYIDRIGKGAGKQKKVIAQQVESVFPQAVSKSTDVVPDIYQKATQQDGWVQLATDLKVGDRVKLMGEQEEGIHEVLEVKAGAFRTAFKPATDKVFVYGREVKDYRSVDYEAIAMLNVSATQELARKVTAQEAELSELRSELARLRNEKKTLTQVMAELESRDARREARLLRLEQTAGGRNSNLQAKNTGTAEEISGR